MNSITPRGFMRMSESFLEFDNFSEGKIGKVLNNVKGSYAAFPIRNFDGYLEIFSSSPNAELPYLEMTVDSTTHRTVCKCFVFGTPSAGKMKSAFSSMKEIIAETERDLSFLGYARGAEGNWRRHVGPGRFFEITAEFPRFPVENVIGNLNLSDFDGVVFFTPMFHHLLYSESNKYYSGQLITASIGMSPVFEAVRFECEEYEKYSSSKGNAMGYGKVDHYTGLPSVLRDLKVNFPKTRLIGKGCYRFALKDDGFTDGFIRMYDLKLRKGAMETCIL